MGLKLNTASSGSVTLEPANTASNYTLTVPAQTGTIATTVDAGNYYAFKNRIINGDMRIDQRNAGAAVTAQTYYTDRWRAWFDQTFTFQQVSDAPTGFTHSLKCTKTNGTQAGWGWLGQYVEGFNVADFGFGAASASTVTLSFWVKSSITGTWFAGLMNSATNRSYPTTYTINQANTWEYKTVTIAGDTSGTWLKDNGTGIIVAFNFGASASTQTPNSWNATGFSSPTGIVGLGTTNGATFYITGVQLEKGSVATSFDYRPYGTEFHLCQRYYQRIGSAFYGMVEGTTTFNLQVPYWQPMRTSATITQISGGIFSCRYAGDTNITNPTLANITSGFANVWLQVVSSGLTNGVTIYGRSQNTGTNDFLAASAEL